MKYEIDDRFPLSRRHPNETIRQIIRYDSGYIKDLLINDTTFILSEQCYMEIKRLTRGHRHDVQKSVIPIRKLFVESYLYDFNDDEKLEAINMQRLKEMGNSSKWCRIKEISIVNDRDYGKTLNIETVVIHNMTSDYRCSSVNEEHFKDDRTLLLLPYTKHLAGNITRLAYNNELMEIDISKFIIKARNEDHAVYVNKSLRRRVLWQRIKSFFK